MRILYDHQIFSIQQFGGISRVFIELIRLLSCRRDCQIQWYRGFHQDRYEIADFRSRLSRYWSFSPESSWCKKWKPEQLNSWGFAWFQKTAWSDFDIYHPTYYDWPVEKTKRVRKLVVTVHDMIGEKFLAHLDRFRPMLENKRRYIERADLILAVSEHTKRDLIDMMSVAPAKIKVVYNASRLHEVAPAPIPNELAHTPYFLYVGTRSKYKNFDVLMRAFALNKRLRTDFKVVCFGGTNAYLPPEVEYFQQHGVKNNFLYCTGEDSLLHALYEKAVALVYTSRYEGFGLPPLEAMACQCPVICGAHSSLPEVVGDAAYFVNPDSAEELAEAMLRVADDSVLVKEMVRKGRSRAAMFSWENTAQATLEGYRAVSA